MHDVDSDRVANYSVRGGPLCERPASGSGAGMRSEYMHWLLLWSPTGVAATCPACGEDAVRCLFGGDPITRMGAGVLWCTNCASAARISRARAPASVPILSFEEWGKQLAELGPLTFVEAE